MSSPQNLTAVTDIRQGSWGRFNVGMNLKNQPGTWAPRPGGGGSPGKLSGPPTPPLRAEIARELVDVPLSGPVSSSPGDSPGRAVNRAQPRRRTSNTGIHRGPCFGAAPLIPVAKPLPTEAQPCLSFRCFFPSRTGPPDQPVAAAKAAGPSSCRTKARSRLANGGARSRLVEGAKLLHGRDGVGRSRNQQHVDCLRGLADGDVG